MLDHFYPEFQEFINEFTNDGWQIVSTTDQNVVLSLVGPEMNSSDTEVIVLYQYENRDTCRGHFTLDNLIKNQLQYLIV